MCRAKIIANGDERVVRLPPSVHMPPGDVTVQTVGGMLVLIPGTEDFEQFGADLAQAPLVTEPVNLDEVTGSIPCDS